MKGHAMARFVATLAGVLLVTLAAHAFAADYATPEAAVEALETALKADSVAPLREVFGPGSEKLLVSGDPVADREARRHFLESLETSHRLDAPAPDRRILVVGPNEWPSPIPLVEQNGRWHFDSAAGAQEIVDRRIGRNEIEAIRTLLAVADAQKDFFERSKEDGGTAHYARRFIASPGQQDGLYWPADDDETPSPLAPLGEIAEQGGYTLADLQGGPAAFQGYRFRMLTGQGKLAPGGTKSYLAGNQLTGGYAVLAWPATYEASGIMSFVMGPDGVVYQTDLGPQTAEAAARITRFDPGLAWARVDIAD
jgi:Protein of unknown function (DUF2950)